MSRRRTRCAAARSTQNNFRRPIDVNDPEDQEKVNLVVKHHFTPEVAALIRGATAKLPGDIHYTLRHIPNHYGALDAMARFQLQNPARVQSPLDGGLLFRARVCVSTEGCPSLPALRNLSASCAAAGPRPAAAYAQAESSGLESPELYYNRGLLEFERKNYEVAAAYASKAYAGGYPLPALRNKLAKAGIPIPST